MNEFEKVVMDIGKGIEWPFVRAGQLIGLLTVALKDEPGVKAAVVGLVQQIEAVTADGAIVIAAKGIDVTADLAEVAQMKALWNYVTGTFLPDVEAAWSEIKPEIDALNAASDPSSNVPEAPLPATPGVTAAAVAAPGLHTVVPK